MANPRILCIVGTRPEFVKMEPVLRLLGPETRVLQTGQHFDATMTSAFFDDLPGLQSATHMSLLDRAGDTSVESLVEPIVERIRSFDPRVVVAQGDTNSVAAAALAARDADVPFAHVEAGLRSFDDRMPEEANRVLADSLATLLFAPTKVNVGNLAGEGIAGPHVHLTGNTVVDVLMRMLPSQEECHGIVRGFGLEPERFVMCTLHRPENVDSRRTLEACLSSIEAIAAPVLFPIHPRTGQSLERHRLTLPRNVVRVDPMPYRPFVGAAAASALIVSDSGGIQEEASVFKRPVVVVRRSTERPEVEGTFVVRHTPGPAVARAANEVLDDLPHRLATLADIPSPYGDGRAAERIADLLRHF